MTTRSKRPVRSRARRSLAPRAPHVAEPTAEPVWVPLDTAPAVRATARDGSVFRRARSQIRITLLRMLCFS